MDTGIHHSACRGNSTDDGFQGHGGTWRKAGLRRLARSSTGGMFWLFELLALPMSLSQALPMRLHSIALALTLFCMNADAHEDPAGDIHPQVRVEDGKFAVYFL